MAKKTAKPKTVKYKGITGPFHNMKRDQAKALILAAHDRSPMKGEILIKALNQRLVGATIEEFLAEREKAAKRAQRKGRNPHAICNS